MRNKILASLILGLSACAPAAQTDSVSETAQALISVSAADLAALGDDETLTLDLTLTNVVYEIDGDSAPLDLDRMAVATPNAESIPMRDFIDLKGLGLDENNFYLRLSGNSELLLEQSALGSTSQALKGSVGGPGGGGLGFVCIPGWCTCSGYDDCIDMFDGAACGPIGGCDDTNGTNCWCLPPLGLRPRASAGVVIAPAPGVVKVSP